MKNYIDSSYYYETFKGDLIPQEKFELYAMKASNKVRNRIFNRDINGYESEVKNATCLVAEILYNQSLQKEYINNLSLGIDKQVTSEKVGDYSRNISNLSISDLEHLSSNENVDKKINEELENCLYLTGLLYAGVKCV